MRKVSIVRRAIPGAALLVALLATSGCGGSSANAADAVAQEPPVGLVSVSTDDGAMVAETAGENAEDPAPAAVEIEPTQKDAPPAPVEPEPIHFDQAYLAPLPNPNLTELLPTGLPTAAPEDLTGEVALPVGRLTAGFSDPDNELAPVIALQARTELGTGQAPARWAVVGTEPGWVKLLLPVGRGSVPSADKADVNHHAVWVRDFDVVLQPEPYQIKVDVASRTLSLFKDGELVKSTHVGVGVESETPTPRGLCQVSGHITTQSGAAGLVTSCQSEALDGFSGATYAAFAIHQGTGFDRDTGGAVSNGCIRVPDSVFDEYFADVPVGTPVIVE